MMDCFIANMQLLTSQDTFWLHIDGLEWIIVMFLSTVWILILMAPIHYRGSACEQVM